MKKLAKRVMYAAIMILVISIFVVSGYIASTALHPDVKSLIAAAPALPALPAGILTVIGAKTTYRFASGVLFACVGLIGATWLQCLPHRIEIGHCISIAFILLGCIGLIVSDIIRFPRWFVAWMNS